MKNEDKGMTRKQMAADMKIDKKKMAAMKKSSKRPPARTVLTRY